jgi:hypothetical protein
VQLVRLYALRFSAEEKARKAAVWRVLCRSFFQRYVDESDTVLDIGAGYCEFVNHIVCRRKLARDLRSGLVASSCAPSLPSVSRYRSETHCGSRVTSSAETPPEEYAEAAAEWV